MIKSLDCWIVIHAHSVLLWKLNWLEFHRIAEIIMQINILIRNTLYVVIRWSSSRLSCLKMAKWRRKKTFSWILISNWHKRRMNYKVWADNSRFLQESNLAARQPLTAPHHVRHLILQTPPPNEGLFNLMGNAEFASRSNAPDVSHYSTAPRASIKKYREKILC